MTLALSLAQSSQTLFFLEGDKMTKTAIDGKTGMLNQRFYQCLKDCLSGYRRMTASVKRRLTRMGFRVVEETYIKNIEAGMHDAASY